MTSDTNCLSYGLARITKYGGYLLFRCSERIEAIHVMWVGGDGLRHYAPVDPPDSNFERVMAALTGFEGKVLDFEDSAARPVKLRWIFISSMVLAFGAMKFCVKEGFRRLISKVKRNEASAYCD